MSHDLRLERVYDAAPEVVFDAFTDPDAQQELYADVPDWVVEAECDLRVGGRWSIAFGPPGDTPARETNVFQVVERPRRLVYASTMTMPDGSSLDTRMQVTFEDEGGRTRMTIVQSGFPTPGLRDEFAGGWAGILDGLGRVVTGPGRRAAGDGTGPAAGPRHPWTSGRARPHRPAGNRRAGRRRRPCRGAGRGRAQVARFERWAEQDKRTWTL